ncbi:MAG: hypothetical protein ACOC2Q_03170, partial [Spirochaetota bacterium]
MQYFSFRTPIRVFSAIFVIFLSGCATLRPPVEDPAEQPTEPVPAEQPEEQPPEAPPEPVLTVPEAYDAISLSVQAGDPQAAIAAYEEAQVED